MFKIVALDMIAAPNVYGYADQNIWNLQQDTSATLWGMLYVVDALSERRYIPAAGSTLQVTFWRANRPIVPQSGLRWEAQAMPGEWGFPEAYPSNCPPLTQSIVLPMAQSVVDPCLFSFDLTETQVSMIMSGTVNFVLTENTAITSWNQNWGVRRTPVKPGA